jgi:hypothetical protein
MNRRQDAAHRELVCPGCGDYRDVEVTNFTAEDGSRCTRLVCRCIVHEHPVEVVYVADVMARRSGLPEGGLVGELDLYAKLEEVVNGLPSMAEHGVVEHLFAHAYPDDYVLLWRRFGHVATHGARKYTVTTYLGMLLGTLGRERAIARTSTPATGIWSYNTTISAVGPWRLKGSPIMSWEQYATQEGVDPQTWPAIGLLPEDELPGRPEADASL